MITIAHLELATVVIGLGTMLSVVPTCQRAAVLALSDNTNTVSWARRAGARDRRAAALIRLLGPMEVRQGFSLAARHIEGIRNEEADYISRNDVSAVIEYLANRPLPGCASAWVQVEPAPYYIEQVWNVLSSTI